MNDILDKTQSFGSVSFASDTPSFTKKSTMSPKNTVVGGGYTPTSNLKTFRGKINKDRLACFKRVYDRLLDANIKYKIFNLHQLEGTLYQA